MDKPYFFSNPEIQKATEIANIEIYKSLEKAEGMAAIELRKKENLEERKFNLEIEKEARANVLEITDDGCWWVGTKLYDGTPYQHKFANLQNLTIQCFQPIGVGETCQILMLSFRLDANEENLQKCIIRKEEMTRTTLKKKLIQSGVKFYVKTALLNALFDQFVANIVKLAENIEIPRKHGWYRRNNQYCYAGKNDLTWEALEKYV